MFNKEEIRQAMKERLSRMSEKDRDSESRILQRDVKQFLEDTPKHIAGFMPLSDEPNLRPLFEELLANGWTLSLPTMENNQLVFRLCKDLEKTVKGSIGILEPSATSKASPRESLEIILIPGRAFTKTGERMGRGNGGYDCWTKEQRKENPQTQYVGVCFECQLLGTLPTEPHDQNVDKVITPRGVFS